MRGSPEKLFCATGTVWENRIPNCTILKPTKNNGKYYNRTHKSLYKC